MGRNKAFQGTATAEAGDLPSSCRHPTHNFKKFICRSEIAVLACLIERKKDLVGEAPTTPETRLPTIFHRRINRFNLVEQTDLTTRAVVTIDDQSRGRVCIV
jgi:hypothetical protein